MEGTVALLSVSAPCAAPIGRSDDVQRLLSFGKALLCPDPGYPAVAGDEPAARVQEAAERIGCVHLKEARAEPCAASAQQVSFLEPPGNGLILPLGQGGLTRGAQQSISHIEVVAGR
jgi:sugar phosphate isomerase/epimerase